MNATSITRVARVDLDELEQLFKTTVLNQFEREGISTTHADDIEPEIEGLLKSVSRDLDSNGRDEHFLIARDGTKIVGTIAAGPINSIIRKHISIGSIEPTGIKCAYVLPEFQGRGFGSELLRHILQKLRQDGVVEFCLDCGYAHSQQIWTHILGAPTIVLDNYWGPGADHLIWQRRTTFRQPPIS